MKKKILLAFIITIIGIVAFGITSVSAETYGKFTYTVSNGEVTITDYKSSYSDPRRVKIPDTIGSYPVTTIADKAFFCSHFELVTIPNSIKTIGNEAFSCCRDLTCVTIPSSVTTIGECPFTACSDLTSIDVDSNNTKYTSFNGNLYNKDKTALIQYAKGKTESYFEIPDGVINIGNGAFAGSKLTSVTIPDSVTSIGKKAFYSCDNLTNIIIPEEVTTIGDQAFADIYNIASITIPKNVTTIGTGAFTGCYNLTSIDVDSNNTKYTSVNGNLYNKDKTAFIQYANGKTESYFEIPDGVTNIGNGAFARSKLTSVTIPDSVTVVGNEGFYDCNHLASVIIPDSVTAIGKKAFYECNKLTSVTIGKGITTIGYGTFAFCNNLESIIIGKNVNTVDDMAFYYCSKLADVYYNGTQEEWEKVRIWSSNVVNNEYLEKATKKFFWYVTLFDNTENKISNKMYNIGTVLDISDVEVPGGYAFAALYADKEHTILYDIKIPINENLTLYVDFIKLNALEFDGTESADIGQKEISESVTFATDKTAKYFVANIKYSSDLSLSEIKSEVFDIEKDEYTEGGQKYLSLTCTNKVGGNIPINTEINAFDLTFDVSENATANDILSIEFVNDETLFADDNGNNYSFDGLGKAEIKVNPILVSSITINGADEIDIATQYTAVISPENATNKEVEWTVDNSEIATISSDGTLTPVKAGTVKVKATAKDGSDIYGEKSVNVKVYATITSLSANAGVWDKAFTPTEKEYTIYIPKNTSSIKLTAKHSGTLKSPDKTFINNVPKTISLTDTETILAMTYSATGYTDSEYKIKIVKFEGTKTTVSNDGTTFTVKPINIANGNTVILALYNGEELAEVQFKTYTGENDNLTFATEKSYTSTKVMVWDSISTLKPVCEVETVKQNRK